MEKHHSISLMPVHLKDFTQHLNSKHFTTGVWRLSSFTLMVRPTSKTAGSVYHMQRDPCRTHPTTQGWDPISTSQSMGFSYLTSLHRYSIECFFLLLFSWHNTNLVHTFTQGCSTWVRTWDVFCCVRLFSIWLVSDSAIRLAKYFNRLDRVQPCYSWKLPSSFKTNLTHLGFYVRIYECVVWCGSR